MPLPWIRSLFIALALHLSVFALANGVGSCPIYFGALLSRPPVSDRDLFEIASQFKGEHEGKAPAFDGVFPPVFVLYFSPEQAKDLRVEFQNGKLIPKPDSELHKAMKKESQLLVVQSADMTTYLSKLEKGKIHHSSFLGGAPVRFAGEAHGKFTERIGFEIEVLTNRTGHYLVTPGAMKRALIHFNKNGVHVSDVKIDGEVSSVIVSEADFLHAVSDDCASQIQAIEQLILFAPREETRALMRDNLVVQQVWNLVAARALWNEAVNGKTADVRAGHEFDLQDYLSEAKKKDPKLYKEGIEKLKLSISNEQERQKFERLIPK